MKFIKPLLAIVIISFVLFSGCSNKEIDKPDNWIKITDNIYFENVMGKWQSIFYYNEDGEKVFIAENIYIIKYSYDGDSLIAYHDNVLDDPFSEAEKEKNKDKTYLYRFTSFGETLHRIDSDYFVVYNIKNHQEERFSTQSDFAAYCKENNLNLFSFNYSNGMGIMDYTSDRISDSVELISFGNPFLDQLIIDDEVIFEGYISDCKMTAPNIVQFRIQIPDERHTEFIGLSNPNLTLSVEPVSKYKTGSFVYQDIYFDDTVKYDIKSKKVVL